MVTSRRRGTRAALLCGTLPALLSACGAVQAGGPATKGGGDHSKSPRPLAYNEASTAPGDRGPHDTENNAWKRRHDLSPDDKSAADTTANRIRPALEKLRAAGTFSPEAVLQTFKTIGLPYDRIWATPMRTPSWWTSPAPPVGVVFLVRVGTIACVDGDVRPERVLVQVEGPDAEGNCIQPDSH